MGNNSLKDLALAGVVWELSDGKGQKAKGNNADNMQTETNIQDRPALCPMPSALPAATAPVAPDSASIAANGAGDIDSMLAAVAAFDHPLKQFAKNTVLPDIQGKGQKAKGNNALLVITDSPSLDDDETGRILSGPAGDLFDKMIGAINLTRADLSIMPLVFWRAPGGRTPAREELDLCRPFVSRAIELLQPKAILTLGTLAKDEIEGKGQKAEGNSALCPLPSAFFSIFHPNYLLLKPDAKKAAWETLQELQKYLNSAEE